MAGALVRDVLYRVSGQLLDLAPQFVRWTEKELVFALNDGQRAIAKYVPIAGSRIDTIKLNAGSRQSIAHIPAASIKPGDGSTPADVHGLFLNDIVRNMGADGLTPGASVSVAARDALDAFYRLWHTKTGAKAIDHYTFDPRTPQHFYVYPPLAAGGAWVEASLIAAPKDVPLPQAPGDYAHNGASEQAISLDDRWLDDLVNYILARAWMKDAEGAANAANVQLYTGLFINSINAQVQALTGQNPNLKLLPFAPDVPAAAS